MAAFRHFEHALRTAHKPTASTAFAKEFGLEMWDYFRQEPQRQKTFSQGMRSVDALGKALCLLSWSPRPVRVDRASSRIYLLYRLGLDDTQDVALVALKEPSMYLKLAYSEQMRLDREPILFKQKLVSAGAQALALDHNWGQYKRIYDIGGATGSFLAAIMKKHRVRGVVCDQGHVRALALSNHFTD